MKKTLIVYHSRSGQTRRVAQALARRLDADIEEIRIVQPMHGWLGYALCALESLAELTPALRPMRKDPAGYDLVVIGTPVWFWNLSSPVRSWLEQHRPKHRVAFFCTMGGSGSGRAFSTMTALAGREPVATLALIDREIDTNIGARLEPFVRSLRFGRPHRGRNVPHGTPAQAAA
jgi:flavodoxin